MSARARTPLSYLPVLPAPLQSSPPPIAPSTLIHSLDHDQNVNASAPNKMSRLPIRRRGYRSPTGDSFRTFRTLTLSKFKDINKVAIEVGSYVDAIAKERERERERIKRERENASTSASPKISAAPVALGSGPPAVIPGPTPDVVRNESADGQETASVTIATTPLQLPMIPISSQIFPNQHFYPSPPQSNLLPSDPVDGMQTSPEVMVAPLPIDPVPPLLASAPIDSLPASSSASFDPFGNIDSTWSQQPTADFLDMGMDFGMGFDMDMDPITGGGGGAGTNYDRGAMEYEDAFTDDDFSFFDRPSRTAPIDTPTTLNNAHIVSSLTPAVGSGPLTFSSPLFGEGLHQTGPGSLSFTPGQQPAQSPWATGPLGDVFTPKFSENDVTRSDILLPSPGPTPWSHSAPSSPNVQLSYDHNQQENRRPRTSHGPSVFDPIPFAPCHRLSDGKYAVGKFALPSPPDEEDRTEEISIPSSSPLRNSGWKIRYNAATDPRIGLVRKLIGVKRKSFDQGFREAKTSPFWDREHEDWGTKAVTQLVDNKSEAESDEDVENNDSPIASRSSTPLPAYLPLGPTFLHTQFQHCQLLPLSTPLRPPGAAVAPTNITSPPAPTSVPTPVSPAAVIGAASEKSKSLEAAACAVAREVIENPVWASTWRTNISRSGTPEQAWEIWQSDVMAVKSLLQDVPVLTKSLDLAGLFETGKL